jgi:Protein of unknown function (DUF3164)
MTETATRLPDGIIERGGRQYMLDDREALVPVEAIKPQHKLEDEMVRKVFGYAIDLSDQVGRFFAHTMADLDGHDALLAQEYRVTRRGTKGNRTYTSFDGLMRVQVQVAERISFGPELQQAKSLIDECLTDWSDGAQAELQAFVSRAFDVDKEGQVRPAELFRLRRFDSKDPRWQDAMRAIADAVRPRGTKQYVRFYRRNNTQAAWEPVTIDLARV